MILEPPVAKVKERKTKITKGCKFKLKRHRDAVLALHSSDGVEGDFLISGSADHTVRCKLILFPFINRLAILIQIGT